MKDYLKHQPVMVDEVVSFINPKKNKIYFDGTFGQGGYTKKILEKASCSVFAIDRDPDSLNFAKKIKKNYPKNFFFEINKLSNIRKILQTTKIDKFDGIMLDLGISNTQLNNPDRGFAFSSNGPLDMRMNKEENSITAKHIVNKFSEKQLSEIFFHYGEERNSRKISKAIINFRENRIIETTKTLANIIEKINVKQKIHPATRVFQALRIFVNEELSELKKILENSLNILTKDSRIAIVSFHSLEDRIVKKFFKKHSSLREKKYKHFPEKEENNEILKILTKKIIKPSLTERSINPRSRSARLRVAEKL